jgi:isocitrate/isopropylmalate dehydrogenase
MSATQVIEEIKHLPRAEQSRVLQFAFELARERQMPGKKLSELAQQMSDSDDSAEVKKIRDEIHRGFYGE